MIPKARTPRHVVGRYRLAPERRERSQAPPLVALAGSLASREADPAMRPLVRGLLRAARSSGPVLLTGESGVGKEYFARQLHRLRWASDAGFVALLAPAMTEERLASSLAGHAGAASTGEVLRTLYLRNVDLLPASLQERLARWMDEGPPERGRPLFLVAGTQAELVARVGAGLFDRALARRLARGWVLRVPPVRERRGDRLFLAGEILADLARDARCPQPDLPPEAWRRILTGAWPGNVRELTNALRRIVLECHRSGQPSPIAGERSAW